MPTINSVPYDFASLELGIPGGPCLRLQSMSWGLSVELEKDSGSTREDIDRSPGIGHVDDAEVEASESDVQRMIAELGNGYMMAEFPATLTMSNTGEPLRTVEFKRCQIIKMGQSAQKGPTLLTRTMTWSIMKLKDIGGLDPFNASA